MGQGRPDTSVTFAICMNITDRKERSDEIACRNLLEDRRTMVR